MSVASCPETINRLQQQGLELIDMARITHKYMPDQMSEEELKGTFAARHHTLDYLVDQLHKQMDTVTLTSYIITGERGAGKTTLIRMLCLRIRDDTDLCNAWLPVRFPEELPTVHSLRDLFATALDILVDQNVPEARTWFDRVDQEINEEQSQNLAITGLRQIAQQQNRRIILFVENLDMVFERGLTADTRATLRRLLMTDPFLMIVGSAVRVFPEIGSYGQAFFNYFCPVDLPTLSQEQACEILTQRAHWEGNEHFEKQRQKHQPKIRAISLLTGGNPRLLMMLYEILCEQDMTSAVSALRTLIDELTPLLKDILEHQLTKQQVKIIDALMKLDGKATPSQLAKQTRMKLNTITTQLKRLLDSHMVECQGGGKGRTAWYTVCDRMFYTWYQMRYLRPQRRRIEMFVEVLQIWFETDERYNALNGLMASLSQGQTSEINSLAESAEYFAASLVKTPHETYAKGSAIKAWLMVGEFEQAVGIYDDFYQSNGKAAIEPHAGLTQWLQDHGDIQEANANIKDAIDVSQKLLQQHPENMDLLLEYGIALILGGDKAKAISCLSEIIETSAASPKQKSRAILYRRFLKGKSDDMKSAISDYTRVIEMEGTSTDVIAQALNNRGAMKKQNGDIVGTIADYTNVIEMKKIPVELVAQALIGRGIVKRQQGNTENAIIDFTAVVEMEGVPIDQVAEALISRGAAKGWKGDTEGAITDCSAVIAMEKARTDQVATALYNRGLVKKTSGNIKEGILDWITIIKTPGVSRDIVLFASFNAYRAGFEADNLDTTDTVITAISDHINNFDCGKRNIYILLLLGMLARFRKPNAWLYMYQRLLNDQPKEVADVLHFFKPVAETLESGDRTKLDPLPPEQYDFAVEILNMFKD